MNIQSIKDIMWNNLSIYNVDEVNDICDAIIDLVQSNTSEWISVEDRLPDRSGKSVVIVNIGIPDKHEKFSPKSSDFIRGKFFHNGSVYRPSHWCEIPSIEELPTPPKAEVIIKKQVKCQNIGCNVPMGEGDTCCTRCYAEFKTWQKNSKLKEQ